jgi:hypothetical protein
MIDPYHLYNRFASLVNTYQGGFFRLQTDFERAANDINMEIWSYFTKIAEKTQEVTDYLAPFTVPKNIQVQKQSTYYGLAPYPSNYARFSSARLIVHKEKETCPNTNVDDGKCLVIQDETEKQIEINKYYEDIEEVQVDLIDDSRWAACVSHRTKMPTLKDPKIKQYNNGFYVAPRSVSVIVLTYYVEPKYVKINYTLTPGNVQTGAGDQIIYTPTPGEAFLWSPTLINEFLIRLGERYGYFTRDQFMATIKKG